MLRPICASTNRRSDGGRQLSSSLQRSEPVAFPIYYLFSFDRTMIGRDQPRRASADGRP